jgi:probable biosynthetic protein (TIGR04099 family)
VNLHIRAVEAAPPLTSVARHTLGMPHLCVNGLSENWLWKELGHRHWGLIAEAFGRGASGFGPSDEPPIYAAFRNIALRDGDLASVGENDALDVLSTVTHLSGSRVVSRHVAVCQDRLIADVEMTSVFVRRRAEGKNRSVARVRIDARRRFAAFDGNPLPLGGERKEYEPR